MKNDDWLKNNIAKDLEEDDWIINMDLNTQSGQNPKNNPAYKKKMKEIRKLISIQKKEKEMVEKKQQYEQNFTVVYAHPTLKDCYPYGFIWKSILDDGKFQLYVQCSSDKTSPNWQKMGSVLEIAFMEHFNSTAFFEEVLQLYKYNKEQPMQKIAKMMRIDVSEDHDSDRKSSEAS